MGLDAMILAFLIFGFKLALSLSSFTLIKRLLSSSLLSAIRVVSSEYLRLLFLPPILILACNSSSPAFLMMCSPCRLNKQGDSRQPCHTPFSVLKQSVGPYRVQTVQYRVKEQQSVLLKNKTENSLCSLKYKKLAHKFLRRQVRWSDISVPLRASYSLLWST